MMPRFWIVSGLEVKNAVIMNGVMYLNPGLVGPDNEEICPHSAQAIHFDRRENLDCYRFQGLALPNSRVVILSS